MMKYKIFTTFIASLMIGLTTVLAEGNDLDVEEFISTHQEKVERAAEDDWKTPAQCAEALIKKRISSEKALKWINRSIEIRETAYNRIIKGDYLVLTGKVKEGQKEYLQAMKLAKAEGKDKEIPGIQWKILISMGVENYNNFQAQEELKQQ